MKPKKLKKGDPFSARHVNSMIDESMRSRADRATGEGIVNDNLGNQVFNEQFSGSRLCVAVQDFEVAVHPTDFYEALDKAPSAKCLQLRLNSDADYVKEKRSKPFRVYDPLSYLNNSGFLSEGDAFWATFNRDTKRWEVSNRNASMQIEIGQVRRCLGRGWYEVNMAGKWSGKPREVCDWITDPNIVFDDDICVPCGDSSGSGSGGSVSGSGGSGSGSGSGDGDGCDDCASVEAINCMNGSGDERGYFIPVDSPGPPVVEKIVYAHTFHPILYSVGSWLKIVRRPDVSDEGLITRSGSGSGGSGGSGSGSTPDEIDFIGKRYDIIDGQVPLKKLTIPEYQLCRNETTGECTVILARTSTIYFPYMSCGVVEHDQCREVTNSGAPSGAE